MPAVQFLTPLRQDCMGDAVTAAVAADGEEEGRKEAVSDIAGMKKTTRSSAYSCVLAVLPRR